MANDWVRRSDGSMSSEKEGTGDIEFKPEKLKEDITNEVTTKFTEFSTAQDAKLKPLLEMAESIKADREQREATRLAAETKKRREDDQIDDTDFMLDPNGAMERKLNPTNNAVRMLAARMAKQDTLVDKEYYHGEMKAEVDRMISQQTLENQMKPDIIENCYKLVHYNHLQDISEGKIKSRTASTVFEGGSTGGHGGKDNSEGSEVLSAEEKEVAKHMGISDKDWITSRREMSYV